MGKCEEQPRYSDIVLTWEYFISYTEQMKIAYCCVFYNTAQKMEFSNKDFFSKYDQICSFLPIWSHFLKKF